MPIAKSISSLQLQDTEQRRLLYHYDHIVAPNMAWADMAENPWRHTIIPLALESPALLNAILAFAAKHLNAVSFSKLRENTSMMPVSSTDSFQQQAVKLLAREIQEFAAARSCHTLDIVGRDGSQNRSNAILATMLVLCNVETVWPGQFALSVPRRVTSDSSLDSPFWQVHLNAARTVLASQQDSTSLGAHKDSTSVFLEQELFIANTFASTTNFLNPTTDKDFKLITATPKPSGIFIEFLKLLQMVTSLERQAITSPTTLDISGVTPSGLRKLFENARSRTLDLGKTFRVSGANDQLHLSRTVNCFYHAGLIYSYRALLKDDVLDPPFYQEKQTQLETSKVELFRAFGFAEPSKPTFAQDLVWPLFIAGTEASRKEEQEMVVARLQQAMSETGFSNCQHALEFLEELWRRSDSNGGFGERVDWIPFAREWTGMGRTFLVF